MAITSSVGYFKLLNGDIIFSCKTSQGFAEQLSLLEPEVGFSELNIEHFRQAVRLPLRPDREYLLEVLTNLYPKLSEEEKFNKINIFFNEIKNITPYEL